MSSPPVELVLASFDDPIVTGLRAEREARPGPARPVMHVSTTPAGGPPPYAGVVFLVARQAGAPVGCAGLRPLGKDTAEVEHLYVRPAYTGPDITCLLLAGVEDLARRRGFTVARLAADDLSTSGLYVASGYVRIAPYKPHSDRSVCYEKSLRGAPPQGGRVRHDAFPTDRLHK